MIKVNYEENDSIVTNENKEQKSNLLRVQSKHNTYNDNSSCQIDISAMKDKNNNSLLTKNSNLLINKTLKTVSPSLNIKMNSGIISNIYSQLISSFSDFGGLLLGHVKKVDKEGNINVLIDTSIYIYNRKYFVTENMTKIITKIKGAYEDKDIVGMFFAKSYSFPKLSLIEQKMYIDSKELIQSNNFLFGTFVHNSMNDNGKKYVDFSSSFWLHDDIENKFNKVPYEIINIQDIKYFSSINPIANRSLNNIVGSKVFQEQVFQLKRNIQSMLNEIETSHKEALFEIKEKIKSEIQEFKKLMNSAVFN